MVCLSTWPHTHATITANTASFMCDERWDKLLLCSGSEWVQISIVFQIESMQGGKFQHLLQQIDTAKFTRLNKQAEWKQATLLLKELQALQDSAIKQIEEHVSSVQRTLNPEAAKVFDMKCSERVKARSSELQKKTYNLKRNLIAENDKQQQRLLRLQRQKKELLSNLSIKQQQVLEQLSTQLTAIRCLSKQQDANKQAKDRALYRLLSQNIEQANQVIRDQQRELGEIDELEVQLLKQCQQIQDKALHQIEAKGEKSQRKHTAIFRKIEALISDMEVE